MLLDKKATIERIQQLESNPNKGEYVVVSGLQGFDINVQPASPDQIAIVDGIYGKTFNAFTTTSGIREGDRITISGVFIDNLTLNKQLRVSAVSNWYFGPLPHFELVCTDIK